MAEHERNLVEQGIIFRLVWDYLPPSLSLPSSSCNCSGNVSSGLVSDAPTRRLKYDCAAR